MAPFLSKPTFQPPPSLPPSPRGMTTVRANGRGRHSEMSRNVEKRIRHSENTGGSICHTPPQQGGSVGRAETPREKRMDARPRNAKTAPLNKNCFHRPAHHLAPPVALAHAIVRTAQAFPPLSVLLRARARAHARTTLFVVNEARLEPKPQTPRFNQHHTDPNQAKRYAPQQRQSQPPPRSHSRAPPASSRAGFDRPFLCSLLFTFRTDDWLTSKPDDLKHTTTAQHHRRRLSPQLSRATPPPRNPPRPPPGPPRPLPPSADEKEADAA